MPHEVSAGLCGDKGRQTDCECTSELFAILAAGFEDVCCVGPNPVLCMMRLLQLRLVLFSSAWLPYKFDRLESSSVSLSLFVL